MAFTPPSATSSAVVANLPPLAPTPIPLAIPLNPPSPIISFKIL